MDTEEKDFLEDIDINPKKKQLSEQRLQHLRVKALGREGGTEAAQGLDLVP
jgi:hypothetical protein